MTKFKGTSAPHHIPAARARPNPALWGYGFGAALIGLGLLVLAVALGSALRSATRGVHRLTLPGFQTLTLDEGLYVGILPAPKTGPAPSADGVQVVITEQGGGAVPLAAFPPELAQANKKIGTTLFQAQVAYKGRYDVQSRTPGDAPAELLLLHESLSRNPTHLAVGGILLAVLGGFGLYIIVMTYRRGRAGELPHKPRVTPGIPEK